MAIIVRNADKDAPNRSFGTRVVNRLTAIYSTEVHTDYHNLQRPTNQMHPTFAFYKRPHIQAVCQVYSAAVKATTEALPWIRAADVWHISSIPVHETVFTPGSLPIAADPSIHGVNTDNFINNPDSAISIGTPSDSSLTDTAYFCERVIGKTWSGTPRVVLRSLRAPGRDEAACAARWLRGDGSDGGGIFGDDDDWTDRRLRLLADEWKACAEPGTRYGIVDDAGGVPSQQGPADTMAAETTEPQQAAPAQEAVAAGDVGVSQPPRGVARPFMIHTGHLIVPFGNGRVRQQDGGNADVIGHGVVLAVDRGVDWRPWESHLAGVAAAATRCFERLENEGHAAEKARVQTWADTMLHGRHPEGLV